MSEIALIAGSSGLVGTALLQQLLNDARFAEVRIFVRSPTGIGHPKLREYCTDFDSLDEYAEHFRGTVFFSCLGSTARKTPDKKTYYKIDHDYPLEMARIAHQNGVRQFHLVSAIGANQRSSNFYLRMKGAVERDIAALPFRSVHFYLPSLLTGDRREQRWAERLATQLFRVINPLLIGRLKKYRSISVQEVAKAMVAASGGDKAGIFYYESDEIQAMADLAGSRVGG